MFIVFFLLYFLFKITTIPQIIDFFVFVFNMVFYKIFSCENNIKRANKSFAKACFIYGLYNIFDPLLRK